MQLTTNNLVLQNNVLRVRLTDSENEDVARVVSYLPKPISLTLKVGKPTKSARAYLWKLCYLLAQKLSQSGVVYTKNEVYREAIKACMSWEELTMPSSSVAKFTMLWRKHGIGYSTEVADDDGVIATVFCYYGSSAYDAKDIARLIDYVRMECEQQGIDVRTPKEIALEMQK